jgi:hypothetical protein
MNSGTTSRAGGVPCFKPNSIDTTVAYGTPYNVLFLQLDGDTTCAFFDGGVFFWRSETPALAPDFGGNSYRLAEPRSFRSL